MSIVVKANPIRKRYGRNPKSKLSNQIPEDILQNTKLNQAISNLPSNYNFELHKTIWKIKLNDSKRVALQFPDGLLLFACTISDIIEDFTSADTIIMGDATYGACCIDDYSARALKCDFMVHYGHSCLIPINKMPDIKMLYVFVDIKIDLTHLIETIKLQFDFDKTLIFVSTVQFVASIHTAKTELQKVNYKNITIPQAKPLSPGEILGCTSPNVDNIKADAILFVGDGRFHLESIMISNPEIPAYMYNPYSKEFTLEEYDHKRMQETRYNAIKQAANAEKWGIILGTLGRQGAPPVLQHIEDRLIANNKSVVKVLLSEIFPSKLKLFEDIDAWVQIACPRLSIDWGSYFNKPLLSPYEASIVLKDIEKWTDCYPMDFYANESKGPWTPNNDAHKPKAKLKIQTLSNVQ